MKAVDILLVEDNPGDVRLTQEALNEGRIENKLHVVFDGVEAIEFLSKTGKHKNAIVPDLILLDLNLPKMNGLEVLEKIKNDPELKLIPVIVLTTSQSENDIHASYAMHVNCFVSKPVEYDSFMSVIKSIEDFWFTIVKLPQLN
ncbi:MAG: response regulator [Bacteroidetes bacterium]|jgi:chemotaxis family two-component system response regulator Rcp1|nr:response regulator [Bacteroidota bacterium]MBP6426227.1 response regulator [Bacteroidia bacterium]MBK8365014.1 response regulator [Bacteroidota bacterium]MBK9414376.1 response regulator [Bacteroidota bacterium]MBL0030933.1 response regulator [Bacteroidota bacterium]